MDDRRENIKGVITLEACICVMFFMVLMLLLAGLFTMFMAQNATSHAVLQATESLALDSLAGEKIGDGGVESVSDIVVDILNIFNILDEDTDFATNAEWYEEEDISETVKSRFVAYLTGGDEEAADELLENLNVSGGLDGLDFSKSYIEDNTLYVVLEYELEYYFDIGGLSNVSVRQTACSRLWKSE